MRGEGPRRRLFRRGVGLASESAFGQRELFDWALPRLGLDPRSFQRLGKQVKKRIGRRVSELGLGNLSEYRDYIEWHAEEWHELDARCFVTISRFFRDAAAFQLLERVALPELAARADAEGLGEIRVWSAGAAAGEEAYSLALLWRFRVAGSYPGLALRVLATELDPVSLGRAARRAYPAGCLREVPDDIRAGAFVRETGQLVLRPEHAEGIRFVRGDLRRELPDGPFDLIARRNVAFTYFELAAQRALLARLLERLRPGGFLMIGKREDLPEASQALEEVEDGSRLFRHRGLQSR